ALLNETGAGLIQQRARAGEQSQRSSPSGRQDKSPSGRQKPPEDLPSGHQYKSPSGPKRPPERPPEDLPL
ncbi:Hypothetical predicted protein, partial [Pelobates cultripes]